MIFCFREDIMGKVLSFAQAHHALAVAQSADEAIDRVVLEREIRRNLSVIRRARVLALTLELKSLSWLIDSNVEKAINEDRTMQERLETTKTVLHQINQRLLSLAMRKAESQDESFDPVALTLALMQILGPVVGHDEPTVG